MHPVLQKTFGGLTPQYYFRQLAFGVILAAIAIMMDRAGQNQLGIGMYVGLAISALLYPYSRFVYESIVGFVLGNNVFWVNTFVMLFTKFATMMICFGFAIFIAPIGLAYLYIHHSKATA
ncbi:hypothetical protein [Comamonas sp. lk]|uniref:hypothetical protein n=1 Tax=Comamonas sp. lk TaxID=2201272 RepID=UPI000EABD44B|nr:hypothetical protein [Comamonas sp. lk]